MAFRRISYLSSIRQFRNSPLKFLFKARDPKCPGGELDSVVEKPKPQKNTFEYEPGPMTPLKRKQIHFQKKDGLPVHLKGGPQDFYLVYFTFILTAYGLFKSFQLFRDLIRGPKIEFSDPSALTEVEIPEKIEELEKPNLEIY